LARVNDRSNGNGADAAPAAAWRTIVTGSIAEGTRNCTVTKLTGHLLRRHVDPIVVHALVQAFNATRCVPPLSAEEVERIVGSICGKELQRRQGNG